VKTFLARLILFLFLAAAIPAFALIPNLPSGTLTPGLGATTRLGTFDRVVTYAPHPRIPPGILPRHWSGRGVVILDVFVSTGDVQTARIWQSTGVIEVDDALTATLQTWRIRPHTVYKLYVPVRVNGAGEFQFGASEPL
jgi:hypothetical protein